MLLTTLANVKEYLGTKVSADNGVLTRVMNSVSNYIISWTNRDFISQNYTGTFDGNGSNRLVLPDYPLTAVSSVTVNGNPIAAGSVVNAGYYFDNDSVILNGYTFCKGKSNVVIAYTAGYFVAAEAQTIGASPYHVTTRNKNGAWVNDGGVKFASNGVALTALAQGATPATGQYVPPCGANNFYTFAAADTGKGVLISYGYVPYDIEQACLELIEYRLRDRSRNGEVSRSMGGQTVTFSQKDMPDYVKTTLNQYKRVIPA